MEQPKRDLVVKSIGYNVGFSRGIDVEEEIGKLVKYSSREEAFVGGVNKLVYHMGVAMNMALRMGRNRG